MDNFPNLIHLPGIPIDMVAGTSIGSFVSAVYATEADPDKTVAKCKEWAMVRKEILVILTILTSDFING